jgi:hypothetical protein
MNNVAGRAFLEQNQVCAETLDLEEIAWAAEHHSGGLFVLGSHSAEDGYYVKMHDTWGPGKPDEPGNVVVHEYDPDDPEGYDEVSYFDTGTEAYADFLRRVGE